MEDKFLFSKPVFCLEDYNFAPWAHPATGDKLNFDYFQATIQNSVAVWDVSLFTVPFLAFTFKTNFLSHFTLLAVGLNFWRKTFVKQLIFTLYIYNYIMCFITKSYDFYLFTYINIPGSLLN